MSNVQQVQESGAHSFSKPVQFLLAAAWLTHVIVCLKAQSWGFLIAGAMIMPIAWVHGGGIWLGVF
jgi:hypothetical protein